MKQQIFIVFLLSSFFSFSQNSLIELLDKHNKKSVPYISVKELAKGNTSAYILDARELNEYEISHIKNAIYIGYNHFNMEAIGAIIPNKNSAIVVYCSIGIRSDTIASKLKKEGYTSVSNLYGGIFEWKNNDFPVYNAEEIQTEEIHTFSKAWGKWLIKGKSVY